MNEIRMLVLTKSTKNRNYCVAGIDVDTGKYVRLVSDDKETNGALSRTQVLYEAPNGQNYEIVPLDFVKVSYISQQVLYHQTENLLVGDKPVICRIKRISTDQLYTYLHPEEKNAVFKNSNNKISFEEAAGIHHSLETLLVNDLRIYVKDDAEKGSGKIKADFHSAGVSYSGFSVTDPKMKNGDRFSRAIIVVSIAEKTFYNNQYYKFIAKVFPLEESVQS